MHAPKTAGPRPHSPFTTNQPLPYIALSALCLFAASALAASPTDPVIAAEELILLRRDSSVAGGTLGANQRILVNSAVVSGPVSSRRLVAKGDAIFHAEVSCDSCLIGRDVTLSGAINQASGQPRLELPSIDPSPIGPEAPDVRHRDGSPLSLNPGAYRSVTVTAAEIVSLTGERYSADRFLILGPTRLRCDAPAGCTLRVNARLALRGNIEIDPASYPIRFEFAGSTNVTIGGPRAQLAVSVLAPKASVALRSRGHYYGQFVARRILVGHQATVGGAAEVLQTLQAVEEARAQLLPDVPVPHLVADHPTSQNAVPLDSLPPDLLQSLRSQLGEGILLAEESESLHVREVAGNGLAADDALAALLDAIDATGYLSGEILRQAASRTAIFPTRLGLDCHQSLPGSTDRGMTGSAGHLRVRSVSRGGADVHLLIIPTGDETLSPVRSIYTLICPDEFRQIIDGALLPAEEGGETADALLHQMVHAMELDTDCRVEPDDTEQMAQRLAAHVSDALRSHVLRSQGRVGEANRGEPGERVAADLTAHPEWAACFNALGLTESAPWCGDGRVELTEQCDDASACCTRDCLLVPHRACESGLSGRWQVSYSGPISGDCTLRIVPAPDGVVSWDGECDVVGDLSLGGGVDPATGSFSASGGAGPCGFPNLYVSGSIDPDTGSISGTWECLSIGYNGTFQGWRQGSL